MSGYGVCNSVRVWCLLMGLIPRWDSHWMDFPSVFDPFFCPCISFRQEQFWVKEFEMGGWFYPSTRDHVYLLDMVFSCSISQVLDVLANVIPKWVLGASHNPGIWDFLVVSPVPYPCYTFLFILLILWISILSLLVP